MANKVNLNLNVNQEPFPVCPREGRTTLVLCL